MRFLFFLLALGFVGCGPYNHCTANNCNGCCAPNGLCVEVTTNAQCGTRGAACTTCPQTSTCSAGVCLGAGGGAAGGVTGGGSAGGGTSGGVAGPTFSVIFLWNFAGQTCAQAGVSMVTVNVPNTSVRSQRIQCNTSGTDGAVVQGIPAGSYTATLEGRDGANALKFRGTASLRVVDQDISAPVRLEPVMSSGPGDLLIKWKFPPLSVSNDPTCAQATITKMKVTVNGGSTREENCSVGEPSGAGVRLTNLTGSATIALAAADANGFVYFKASQQVPVVPNASTPVTVTLDWDVGSLPVKWSFRDGSQTLTCTQAGVTSMFLNLRTPQGAFVYPNAGAEVPCNDMTNGQGTFFPYLSQGSYDLFFQAVGTGGKLYKTNQTSPPHVQVRAGTFPALDATTPTYTLSP